MLKKIFYLVLICGAVYRYFGVEFIINKAPFLEPYIAIKGKNSENKREKDKTVVKNIDQSIKAKRQEKVLEKNIDELLIDSIDGDSMILREGKIVALEKGTKVFKGDVIQTSNRAYLVILFGENSRLKIMAKSKVRIKENKYNFHFYLENGKIFVDHFFTDNKRMLGIQTNEGGYQTVDSMFYLEKKRDIEKIVVLGGDVHAERPSEKMDFVIKKKQGCIFDGEGYMKHPSRYPWIKKFPWKNIAYGVVNIEEDKLILAEKKANKGYKNRGKVEDDGDGHDYDDVLSRIKDEATKRLLESKNITTKVIEK